MFLKINIKTKITFKKNLKNIILPYVLYNETLVIIFEVQVIGIEIKHLVTFSQTITVVTFKIFVK